MVQRSFLGVQINPNLPHLPDTVDYTLAAHVRGPEESTDSEVASTEEKSDSEDSSELESDEAPPSLKPLDVLVIADLDFISEQFFRIRAGGLENLNFDNITFFLNSIDVLVGDESFITLRRNTRSTPNPGTGRETDPELYRGACEKGSGG